MGIALAAMAETFIANANAAGIPLEVLHRVASMASGGMDTLPHNGAVITLLAVTGLTHVSPTRTSSPSPVSRPWQCSSSSPSITPPASSKEALTDPSFPPRPPRSGFPGVSRPRE
jgi:hypothetical protein